MKKQGLLFSFLFVILSISLFSQGDKSMTLEDVMKFKQVQDQALSEDGKWICLSAVPDRGDPTVYIYSTDGKKSYSFPLADKVILNADGSWAAARKVVPALDLENADKKAKEKLKNGMYIINLDDGSNSVVDSVLSFSFTNNGKWLMYHKEKTNTTKAAEDKPASGKATEGKSASGKVPTDRLGDELNLLRLGAATPEVIPFVTSFAADSASSMVAFVTSDTLASNNGVWVKSLQDMEKDAILLLQDSALWASNLSWNNSISQLVFLSGISGKKGKKEKASIYLWEEGQEEAGKLLEDEDLEQGWSIYHKNQLSWSNDGKRLFLGIKPEAELEKDEKKKDSLSNLYDQEAILEKRGVDVWHWNDPYINSQQKKLWNREKDRTYLGCFHLSNGEFVPLANEDLPTVRVPGSSFFGLGVSNVPYAKQVTWKGRINDYYLVDIRSGERRKVLEEQEHRASLSPDGKFLVYYFEKDWFLYNVESGASRNLTAELDVPFADEDWDYPADVPGYRLAGWTTASEGVIINDKFDIWLFPTEPGDPVCLTASEGRKNGLRFSIIQLDRDEEYLQIGENYLLEAYSDTEKYTAIYELRLGTPGVKMLKNGPHKYAVLAKAKHAKTILFTRQSYNEFPDLQVGDMKLKKTRKLSDVNPQVAEFAWGNAELVEWLSIDGRAMQGILIKPGNYVEGKKYPVLVYYYRFFTDRLYNFPAVAVNHRPCFPFYASNDYAIFLPDIRFDVGTPGYSATKSLVPGVQKIIDMGIADPDAIGLHGHSWSGYQTAFIITQSDLFACAIAGAPVSNMTSAYGGIRWGSGMARQFQYEQSQSRIGGSLWEARDKYIENSPLFFADRINTPLLIQFGDEDDAVPWYQGIELYLALRRMEKDCIFLQYRGEPHHLKQYGNKLDYTIKFKEYLDHYLKGEEAADWIQEGVEYRGE